MGSGQPVGGMGSQMTPPSYAPDPSRMPALQQHGGFDPRTLSGLGNFNPGGLGGPGMNSPYWQPPQGGMPQPAMPNPSQSLPGPQQQGLLMPAFAQPFMQGQGMSARKFMRSGMPYQLLQNPQTAGMAGPALGAMTRGVTTPTGPMPTGYVPVVGGKPWLRQYG